MGAIVFAILFLAGVEVFANPRHGIEQIMSFFAVQPDLRIIHADMGPIWPAVGGDIDREPVTDILFRRNVHGHSLFVAEWEGEADIPSSVFEGMFKKGPWRWRVLHFGLERQRMVSWPLRDMPWPRQKSQTGRTRHRFRDTTAFRPG